MQLAVENDRAVFITHDDELGAALWLLNLRPFADWADFASDPPQPVRPSLSLYPHDAARATR